MDTDEIHHYSQMGMAALIPGMQHMLDRMQQELDALRIQLAAAQGREAVAPKRRGRPPKHSTAQEKKLAAPSPDRAAVSAKLSKMRKRAWAAMSPRQRKQRLTAMAAGRQNKANGMAVAS